MEKEIIIIYDGKRDDVRGPIAPYLHAYIRFYFPLYINIKLK